MDPTTRHSRRSIGSFDGNFDELAAFVRASFAENKEQALDYESEYLRSVFEYPGSSFDLAPAIYRDGNLVAFVMGSPRKVRIAGRTLTLLTATLLTVLPRYKKAGYGPLVWRELKERARAHGFDGTIDFCVEGDDMNRQILPLAQLYRLPTRRVFSVSFLGRLLPSKADAPSIEMPDGLETSIFLENASLVAAQVPFARVWTQEEAEWQCHRRINAVTCALAGQHRGILTGYSIKAIGAAKPVVMIDDILWGELPPTECISLANGFLGAATERGAQMVIAPLLGYADTTPLVKVGFRKIKRVLHTYLTLWNQLRPPESIPAMYIDIF
jgi:ribosomal protein S18 acetylase RimI-like enzyme